MIIVCNVGEVNLDKKVEEVLLDSDNNSPCPVILSGAAAYLTDDLDLRLGVSDRSLISWKKREDYTGSYLPHYLNYFMLHLLDGYLRTGGY